MSYQADTNAGAWRARHRNSVSVMAHILLFALALFISFLIAYNFRLSTEDGLFWFTEQYLSFLPFNLAIKLAMFGALRLYRDSWRYVGLRDLFQIIRATHFSVFFSIVLVFAATWMGLTGQPQRVWVPTQVLVFDWVFTIAVVSSARVAYRFYYEELRPLDATSQRRMLIIGAGDTADSILREIFRTSEERFRVVGFLDDDVNKQRARIRGIDVLGSTSDIRRICEEQDIDEVLIALPSAPQKQIRELIERCEGMNLQFRTVPAVSDLIEGKVQVSQIRPVDIEDLLGRDPVTLDTDAIGDYIHDKVVMVTGAGGSIGSEMCRQIARFKPRRLLLLEQMENALFEINREIERSFPTLPRVPCVADIVDRDRVSQLMAIHGPSVVFHAAAHKHVPMMEWNPGEAIKNNIIGTRTLADCASAAGVAKFVMISTDKAVNPTSVMGCTKRVAEMYVQQLASHTPSQTEFVTVRFGNVLGSSGSVVPIFKEQIAQGGPVTVTDPEMTRYFMTIPEAAQLVLQAGAMGEGGEIFLLDMGEPVKIKDLAVTLIQLSGLRPHDDIEISYSGMRPGEKLFEELSIEGEDVSRTGHPKIGIIRKRPEDFEKVCAGITDLISIMDEAEPEQIRSKLQVVVPEYIPSVIAPPKAKDENDPSETATTASSS